MMRLFLLSAIVALSSLTLKADTYYDGAKAALSYNQGTIEALGQVQFNERAQIAINQMVLAANEALAESGYGSEAAQNQQEWDQNFSSYFLAFDIFNLGDHKPLNAWLDTFYKKTESRLGLPVMKLLHLDDIRVINYAIPVVFQPAGDKRNGDHWNRVEYSLHFVPFATVVTYWGSLTACKLISLHFIPLKRFCGAVASILRGAMGNMIAPKLSNYVYAKAGGKAEELDLNFAAINNQNETKIGQIERP
jgi:hypothetical protein